MGKSAIPKYAKTQRHDPLYLQIQKDVDVSAEGPRRVRTKEGRSKKLKENEDYVDSKISKKILEIAKEQQDELRDDAGEKPVAAQRTHVFGKQLQVDSEDEEDVTVEYEETEEWADYEDDMLEISEQDQALLEQFFPSQPKERQNLADIISAKLQEHEQNFTPEEKATSLGMNPKVVEVYSKVGILLSRYKSGKLPKAFKIIPSLANWEDVLYITRPDEWTPNAMFEATKIFISNFNANMAQRFLNLVLLERVRDDINRTKKLNYHLYMALKKALYKPAAFFKGILLPLCEGNCTLREAAIIGSVLAKVSVPALHSSAALLKIAEMDYTGSNSLFLRVLLDKKYALPYKVVDSLIFHFLRFKHDERTLPVLWHQCLLVFVQRYKQDLTPEQKEALLDLLKYKNHEGITPEVRREIVNSSCRGEVTNMEVEMVDV
ncbi:Bystin-domain-containing protein [Paraphysoderma sedebokerense]|nr:Bystin-domain-containing protein [Paraphysoderma sedebokerense]